MRNGKIILEFWYKNKKEVVSDTREKERQRERETEKLNRDRQRERETN